MKILQNNPILRKRIIRALIVVLWIGLGVVIILTSRGHSILVDNRDAADESYKAEEFIIVSIDNQKPIEVMRRDRVRFMAVGPNHKIRVEFIDGRAPIEQTFSLELKPDMYLLSVPRMLAGLDFIEVFVVAREPVSPSEEGAGGRGDLFSFEAEEIELESMAP